MSKIQKYSVKEGIVNNKAKANAKVKINSRVAGTKLKMQDSKVLLTAKARGPLIVSYQIPIACIYNKKLQNQKLY
jgi:hypothetical protein